MSKEMSALALRSEARLNVLKSVNLFKKFTDEDLQKIVSNSHITSYKKKKILFLSEDKAACFYVVLSGWVKLFRETRDGHESVIDLMTNGESFGEAAAFQGTEYLCSAEIAEDSILIEICPEAVNSVAREKNLLEYISSSLIKSSLEQTKQLALRAEHLALMTSAQRTGCFLLKLCKENFSGSINLTLPYEKALVAAKLGMTPETFSRSLSQLKKIGVETSGNKIIVNNIEILRNNTCFSCSASEKECKMAAFSKVVTPYDDLKSGYA